MQSRLGSFIETMANIAIGYSVALISQVIIFSWYGIQLPMKDQVNIGLWFTAISIIRSYILRRIFNRITVWRLQRASSN